MSVIDVLRNAATIGGAGFQGYAHDQQTNAARVLSQAKAQRDAENDRVLNALRGAQTTKLMAPPAPTPPRLEHVGDDLYNVTDPTKPSLVVAAPKKPETGHKQVVDGQIVDIDHNTASPIVGFVPPKKGPTEAQIAAQEQRKGQREDRLQQNFQQDPAIKQAGVIANAVSQLRASASQKTPQGDLNMIYGIVKLRDPNSAVREGEIDLQRAARSLGTQVTSAWQKAAAGRTLTDQERDQIMRLVDETVEQQSHLVAPVQKRFGEQSRQAGADSSFVAPDPFAGVRKTQSRPPGFVP